MELKESPYKVEREGVFKDISFQISESEEDLGLIFDILRSKMYSNPMGSICREISSNSRDANREVGKGDKPIIIEIIAPNSLLNISDYCISFRDEGPGISPDRMLNIYSKYAASTKRNTNSQTGGFGLGAKTPMAYSDSFWVLTKHDGFKYQYLCYIDESRKGKITEILKEETSEGNGTEILIPIKQKDISTFEVECYKSTLFWDVKPIFIGFKVDINSYHIKKQPIIENDDMAIYYQPEINYNYLRQKSHFISIDGIPYPIDENQIQLNKLEDYLIILKFSNGQLSPSSNREHLQYDEDTIKLIKQRIRDIERNLSNFISKKFLSSRKNPKDLFKYVSLTLSKSNGFDNVIYYSIYKYFNKRINLIKKYLVQYEQTLVFKFHRINQVIKNKDFEFYSSHFPDNQKVRGKSWTWNNSYKLGYNFPRFFYLKGTRKCGIDQTISIENKISRFCVITPISYSDYVRNLDKQAKAEFNSPFLSKPFLISEEEYLRKVEQEKRYINTLSFLEIKNYSTITPTEVPKKTIKINKSITAIHCYIQSSNYFRNEEIDTFELETSQYTLLYDEDLEAYRKTYKISNSVKQDEESEILNLYFYDNITKTDFKKKLPNVIRKWLLLNPQSNIQCLPLKDKKKFDNQKYNLINDINVDKEFNELCKLVEHKKICLEFMQSIMFLKKFDLIDKTSSCFKFFSEMEEKRLAKTIFDKKQNGYPNTFDTFKRYINKDENLFKADKSIYFYSLFLKTLKEKFALLFFMKDMDEKFPKDIQEHLLKYCSIMKKENDLFDYNKLYQDYMNS